MSVLKQIEDLIELQKDTLKKIEEKENLITKIKDLNSRVEKRINDLRRSNDALKDRLESLSRTADGQSVEAWGQHSDEDDGEFTDRAEQDYYDSRRAADEIDVIEQEIAWNEDKIDELKGNIGSYKNNIQRLRSMISTYGKDIENHKLRLGKISDEITNILNAPGSPSTNESFGQPSGKILEIISYHYLSTIISPGESLEIVGGKGDNGVDLKIISSDKMVAVVQCKQGNLEGKGPAIVRELIGTCIIHGVKKAYLVLTSDTITTSTRETINLAETKGIQITEILAPTLKIHFSKLNLESFKDLVQLFTSAK
ncbi:hypothetical protein CYY_006046 [Polysphondylium violaceum]|uniref:Restriction endonuclease type IV Mrr domain-containing protein n=1 Tax=Polysphondylium violaceum TaxID=133409 RepID=A0A8J4V6A9_9MYCE|nr:hypothetical protein CYY_006046 [Polysphondylium violaceum]